VASDLRLILAAEHIAGNLERAADHAKNIAKRTLSLSGTGAVDPAMRDLMLRLHGAVSRMFADALRAFEKTDPQLAADVLRRDSEPDALYDDLFHAAIAKLRTGTTDAAIDVHALFVGKSLERIGDHATNIAEEVRFLTRGEIPPATRG
jgi:phosphate transport system protein